MPSQKLSILHVIMQTMLFASLILTLFIVPVWPDTTNAYAAASGKSGLPLPRYVSLKSKRVNMRVGPGREYQVSWMYLKQGLPMEIIQEYDNWRRVRDPEGNEGWILHSLLSGKRTAIVAPWEEGSRVPMRTEASSGAAVTAEIEARVVGQITECQEHWCRLEVSGFEGFVEKKALWGVYPDELIEQ